MKERLIDRKFPKLLETLQATDLIDRIESIRNKEGRKQYHIDATTGKITTILPDGMDINSPWIHAHQDPNRNCRLYFLIFDCLEFIPTPCMNCWKVVARPRTVKELIAVAKAQEMLGFYGKAGIEERPYIHALYGAYWYTNSREEGEKRYEQVRDFLAKEVSPDIKVILKRHCSEMEAKLGPSTGYKQPILAKYWEKRVEELVDLPGDKLPQPQYLKDHVMLNWLRFAYVNGDSTSLEFNEGKPFTSQPVTYRNNLEEE